MNQKGNLDIMLGLTLGVAFTGLFVIILLASSRGMEKISDQTKILCLEYATKDHRLEIGEERFKWLSQWGDPNDPEFFYQSCVGHVTGVPAEKEYMK